MVRYETIIPSRFFKYLKGSDNIYEIRVKTKQQLRILCFYDDGNLIILTNCFVKKTKKTPKKEIKKAEQLREEYFSSKLKSK